MAATRTATSRTWISSRTITRTATRKAATPRRASSARTKQTKTTPANRPRPLPTPAEYAQLRAGTDLSHSRTAVSASIGTDAAFRSLERAAAQPKLIIDGTAVRSLATLLMSMCYQCTSVTADTPSHALGLRIDTTWYR